MRFSIIGYGEVGAIFARDLTAGGASDIVVHDISPAAMARAQQAGLSTAASAIEAVRGADVIFVCVTAGSTLAAMTALAEGLPGSPFVIDVNSVSPATKRQAASITQAAGARYVEAAIMASIGPRGMATPMLLGGLHARDWLDAMRAHELAATVFSEEIGKASAVKMCRSIMIKGLEALTAESMLSARTYGVETAVLASLAETIPSDDWPELARYLITRSLLHGKRRAEEVREVAASVRAAGQVPMLSDAIALRQDWCGRLGQDDTVRAAGRDSLGDLLDAMLDATTNNEQSRGNP